MVLGQDKPKGPGTEEIMFISAFIRQKPIMTHSSANSRVFFQNIQLPIVFLWLHQVHSYFPGLLELWKTPFLGFEIFKFLPPGGAGNIFLLFCFVLF